MKLKKIVLTPYEVKDKEEVQQYPVKDVLASLLLSPTLKLNGVELLKNNILSQKILESQEEILLEKEEYNKIKQVFEILQGFAKNDVELIRRVMEAEEVEVEEKK